jgi:hypothetical protein
VLAGVAQWPLDQVVLTKALTAVLTHIKERP